MFELKCARGSFVVVTNTSECAGKGQVAMPSTLIWQKVKLTGHWKWPVNKIPNGGAPLTVSAV
jgi:hypothetical protein